MRDAGASPSVNVVLVGQSMPRVDPRRYVASPSPTLMPLLHGADVVFTNLESPVRAPGCACQPTRTGDVLHDPGPEVLDYLQSLGVNLLALSNNHSWDLSRDGILGTLAEVEARGIVHAGLGRDLEEAGAPAYLDMKGLRIALVSTATVRTPDEAAATPERAGVNLLGLEDTVAWNRILGRIREAAENADAVIVYHHFQTVGTPEWQRRWARATVDAGATLYVSHGEPVLGGVEIYGGRPIFYDLGNFVFQTRRDVGGYPRETFESVVVELTLGRGGVGSVRFTPIVVDEGTPGPDFLETRGLPDVAAGEEGNRILTRLQELSRALGTEIAVADGAGRLDVSR
jgi:poly-gamma-glutamate synthesis protein (capsule biosynthesis protein)